jgi:hypothetical protein
MTYGATIIPVIETAAVILVQVKTKETFGLLIKGKKKKRLD